MSKLFDKLLKRRWADGASVYQIYPRSFQDSNGDGVGDLLGVTSRLKYLKTLGVRAIWLSPFYPSPMADFGYDVSDYCDVDPIFGSLEDFRKMLRSAHKLNIKVMVDIVPNHTSDEHVWFKNSSLSRTNKYSDWYIWKDPIGYDGDKPIPPNNWLGMFNGESAWTWVPRRQQFYLHSFHEKQPDLNWENPTVRDALKDVLRFWLDMGVDGFRVDAVPFMAKDPALTDNPDNPNYHPDRGDSPVDKFIRSNSQGWPKHFDYLAELSDVLKEPRYTKNPRFMVTEGYVERDNVVENYMAYYRAMDPLVAAPFIFEGVEPSLSAVTLRSFFTKLHGALDGHNKKALPVYAFGNHDQSRLVTRLGVERARAVAVLQLTLPGMTFIYNGEEIGMHNVHIPPELIRDPSADGGFNRDQVRTPMQWSSEVGGGFTSGTPWLPLAHNYRISNVKTQSRDPKSFLNLYKSLIKLRNKNLAFRNGAFKIIAETDPQILAYSMSSRRKHFIVVMNFKNEISDFNISHYGYMVISSLDGKVRQKINKGSINLRPHEAVVIECAN